MTQIPIPLLIKEKVQFYYYLQQWKDKLKIIHHQYNKTIIIDDITESTITYLRWRLVYKLGINRLQNRLITIIAMQDEMPKRDKIYRFLDYFSRSHLLPDSYVYYQQVSPKYHYSSGLNHPQAYK